ncbi:hypothetical protein [Solwaraspora sp. WMMA2101]|uniref:hypothetical protein n=1 Tax=Solwaraspora sp. WMMA2101 TaxID=3404124 RepID=UPI003B95EB1A
MTSSRPADEQMEPSTVAGLVPGTHAGRASWATVRGLPTALRLRVQWQPVALTATPMTSLLTVVLYLQLHPARWAWTAVTLVAVYFSARLWPTASRVLPAVAGRLSRRSTAPRADGQAVKHATSGDHQYAGDH